MASTPQVAIGAPQSLSLTNPDGSINWGNVISGAGSAANSVVGNNNTAAAQIQGEQNAINTQAGVQGQNATALGNTANTNAGVLAPAAATGAGASSNLATYLGLNGQPADFSQFYNTPGYDFAVQQGTRAINSQAAAAGSAYTPNTLAAVGNYVQGAASTNYNNYINQLLQTQGQGITAQQGIVNSNTGLAEAGVNSNLSTGANIAQLQAAQGSANASGAANQSGIINSILGSLGGTSGVGSLINSLLGTGGSTGGANSSGVGGLLGAIKGLFGGSSSTGSSGDLSTVDPSLTMTSTPYSSSGSATGDLNQLFYPDGMTGQPATDTSSPTNTTGDTSYLDSYLGNFSGAGGQAATLPDGMQPVDTSGALAGLTTPGNVNLGSPSTTTPGSPSFGSNLSAGAGIIGGLTSGSPTGYASAGLNAVNLANNNNLLGGAKISGVSSGVGYGLNALGIYSGLQQGGVAGDTTAAVSAAQLANHALTNSGVISGAAGGAIGSALSVAGIGLDLYNEVKSYQSGATGSDALSGLQTGAAIGSLFGPLGTVIGGALGAAGGAIASAFGGGKNDAESLTGNNIDAAVANGSVNAAAALAPPSTAFQYLAGVMDAKNPTPGHSQPIEQVFGRMGESTLANDMFTQINSAISSGTISKTATPTQIYNSVVAPWLQSKGAAIDPNSKDVHGVNEGNTLIASLQSLIGNWQSGTLTSKTPVGINGQIDTTLPAFI